MTNLIVHPDIEGYTRPWFEYNSLLREVWDMEDDALVEEIVDICFTSHPEVDKIVSNYFKYEEPLNKVQRGKLITFYILAHGEEGLEE